MSKIQDLSVNLSASEEVYPSIPELSEIPGVMRERWERYDNAMREYGRRIGYDVDTTISA